MSNHARLPVSVFYSYSHKDEDLRDQLEVSLSLLKKQGVIDAWHDRRIVAGDEWDEAIAHNLDTADIILLLVSPDFFASDYAYELETARAIERHKQGTARVIPVILRPVDYRDSPVGKLQALPKDGKPVTSWSDKDEAFLSVSQGIKRAAQEVARRREQDKPRDPPPVPQGSILERLTENRTPTTRIANDPPVLPDVDPGQCNLDTPTATERHRDHMNHGASTLAQEARSEPPKLPVPPLRRKLRVEFASAALATVLILPFSLWLNHTIVGQIFFYEHLSNSYNNHLTVARLYAEIRNYAAAERHFDLAIRRTPDDYIPYMARADYFQRKAEAVSASGPDKGLLEKAIADYTQCIVLHRGYIRPYLERGKLLEKTGKTDQCMNDLTHVIRYVEQRYATPDGMVHDFPPGEPFLLRSKAFLHKGDTDMANRDLEKAIEYGRVHVNRLNYPKWHLFY